MDEDIRKVARLMIDADSQFLPVFEGRELRGVVTVDDVLVKVELYLDAATVTEAHSPELVTLGPDASLGDAINAFREEHIRPMGFRRQARDGRAVAGQSQSVRTAGSI